MRRSMVSAALLFVSGLVLAGPPSASLDYNLPKSTTLGEPVIFTARLHNSTGYRIVVDFGVNDQTEFVFRQTKPDGSVVRVAPSLTPASRMRTSHLMLRDTWYTATVVLDEWLDLSATGRHTIEIEFHGAVNIDGGNEAGLKRKASMWIDVKPRDPDKLAKRGAEWLKQISTLSPGGEARAAASALVAMKDPIAIPYLELATSRTRSQSFVDALRTMASSHPDARAALERLAKNPDADVRALAQKALAGR